MARLDAIEGRVIGSLVEKQLTTPQQYPLTLNALVLACNQSSNRDPVTEFDQSEVDMALSRLKAGGWVRFVHPSHGRSVIRYRQVIDEQLGLDERRLAVMAVLLLRGPQTAGEVRARTERMARFDSIVDVEADLRRLAEEPDPLVVCLPRRPGQKEERWAQLLAEGLAGGVGPAAPETPVAFGGSGVSDVSRAPAGDEPGGAVTPVRDEVADLRAEVAELRSEVAALREALAELLA